MKLIDGTNSDRRDQLKKLEPLAREAMQVIERNKQTVVDARKLCERAGIPEESIQRNGPINGLFDVILSYGTLSLELKE